MATTAESLLQRHRLTVRDYHRMGEVGILAPDARVELIDGEIIDMPPIGSRHAGKVKILLNRLTPAVAGRAIVAVQDPLIFGSDTEPQPDLMLLQPRPDFYQASHPHAADVLLVIEVAESSLAYDRDVKLPRYARQGIPEAWLIDVEQNEITVHRQPAPEGYREVIRLEPPYRIAPVTIPDIVLNLDEVV
jgi:Uma2 family endonuclease